MPFEKYERNPYKPTEGLAKVAFQYSQQTYNYNKELFGSDPSGRASNPLSNAELSLRLLHQQLQSASSTNSNVLVSPITMAASAKRDAKTWASWCDSLKLSVDARSQAEKVDYDSIISELESCGDLTLTIGRMEGSEQASAAFEASRAAQLREQEALNSSQMAHMVKQPFPLQLVPQPPKQESSFVVNSSRTTPSSSTSVSSNPVTHALNFNGYLAPRFTSPQTKFPNYFYNFKGEKTITHMMVKTGKMWYIEHEKFQMVDLPYINQNFVATLILPRLTSDRTIQDHPDEFAYDQSPRSGSTVHEVLKLLSEPVGASKTNLLHHHLKHMQLMQGVVGVPGFTADFSVSGATAASSSTPESHRAVLSISPHGLDVGAKIRRDRSSTPPPSFLALFDRPFIFILRSRNPDAPQQLFAGVVHTVLERKDWSSKYPMPQEWRQYKEQVGQLVKESYAKYV